MIATAGPQRTTLRRLSRGGPRLAALLVIATGCADESAPPELSPVAEDGTIHLTEEQLRSGQIAWSAVEVVELRESVTVPGSVVPPDTAFASVGSIVEGRVARVRVVAGDRVRAGARLVEIHSHELFDAQAALTSAEAELVFHREATARARRLHEAGAIALQELQLRESELAAAEAEVVRATEMVEHLHPTPDGNTTAIAPRDGVVFTVAARPGQAVIPGDPLLTMGGVDPLWVTAYVPEGTSTMLSLGDEARVAFRSPAGARSAARLVRMGEYVDPANRSVEVRFELVAPPAGVRPGTFAEVEISTSEAFAGVELPEDAAVRMGGEDVVFVREGPGHFRPVAVGVMPLGAETVAVTGLENGWEVVTQGAYTLKSTLEATGEGETP